MENSTPYHSIPEAPESHSASAVVARFVDALGFRYRWATEGLTETDTEFRPVESSMNVMELCQHIHSMARWVNTSFGGTAEKGDAPADFESLRKETLEFYHDTEARLKEMDDSALEEVKNFWFMLNGPISDSLTHVGQILSWRRMAGNPQPKGVNQFWGTKED